MTIKKTIRVLLLTLIWLVGLTSYSSLTFADQLALPSTDLVAPSVQHVPQRNPISTGSVQKISAKVNDNVGIKSVVLFYRTIGSQNYERTLMIKGDADLYTSILPVDSVTPPGIEYYIQAEDVAGNTLLHGYSFSPLVVTVKSSNDSNEMIVSENKPFALKPILENKWVWVGLGVVALVLSQSGSDSDSPPPSGSTTSDTGEIEISGPPL